MQTAIFSYLGRDIPFSDTLHMIKDAGFDGVMLWWADQNFAFNGKKEQMPELCEKAGLRVINAHMPFIQINLMWEDGPAGDDYCAHLCKLLQSCGQCGVPIAVVHPSRGYTPPPVSDTGLNRFKKLADTAVGAGVRIAFENLNIPAYLDAVMQAVPAGQAGVCYDSGHNHCFSPERNILKEYHDQIITTHLHDNFGLHPQFPKRDLHLLPLDGTTDWSTQKALLRTLPIDTLALEVEMERTGLYTDWTPEQFLHAARQQLAVLLDEQPRSTGLRFVKAALRDVHTLAGLADEIWRQHFSPILSQEQIGYMLNRYQSADAMTGQMADGYQYYFFEIDGIRQGYFGIQPKDDGLFLSKLYLRQSQRGHGYARQAFGLMRQIAKDLGLHKIWLTVNIHNDSAIGVYKAMGMHIARSQVTDIGHGFVMDDYVFEMPVD